MNESLSVEIISVVGIIIVVVISGFVPAWLDWKRAKREGSC
jgi:hypothetical protein